MRTSVMPEQTQRSSQMSSRGRPRIGSRHLGTESVRGRRRVPWPPASKKAFKVWPQDRSVGWISDSCRLRKRQESPSCAGVLVMVDEGIIHDDLGALSVESNRHLLHTLGLHRHAHCVLACRFGIEQKKSSPAGASNLATQNTVGARYFIEVVDARAGNALGDALLGLPGIVEQMAEVLQVAAHQRLFHQGCRLFHLMERLYGGPVGQARRLFLVSEYVP